LRESALARKVRLPLGFVLAATYLIFARPSPRTFAIGIGLALAGLLIRAWAAGHIDKAIRLATSGPYAYTRNPLYLGSFAIACGFALAVHPALVVAVLVFFVLIYWPTIARERADIAALFPSAYAVYERHVPLVVPRLTPWHPTTGDRTSFSAALYMRHGEWKAALGFGATVAWLLLRARLGI
jgi:protein-S-isoprenylcysteine O-methyltransferase Ste14